MSAAEDSTRQSDETLLVVDCGHTHTTAVLFDVVEGRYRYVARGSAPTTSGPPRPDVLRGVRQAIAQITDATGRRLLNQQGVLISPTLADGSGADYFGLSASAADPLRSVVVGLLDEVSLASARRALSTSYTQEIDHFGLSDGRTQQAQVDAIWRARPDLIFVAGGTDGGVNPRLLKLVETVGLAVGMLDGQHKPQVIYAGNSAMRASVTETLGGVANVHVAANVRPSLESEQLQDAARLVGKLYEEVKLDMVPGMEDVAGWSSYPVVPTARALATIMDYFAALYQGRVLGVDVGSDTVSLVAARPGDLRISVRSDLGSGRPLLDLLRQVDHSTIADWVPEATSAAALRDLLYNKALHPGTVPMTEEELHLEQAVVRELLRRAAGKAAASWGWPSDRLPPFKMLVARGQALTNVPRPGQTVLMLLDALQPTGIFSVAVDRYGLLPALGVLAAHHPLVPVQALEAGVLADLGWVIAPYGRAQPGQTIMNVRMKSEQAGKLDIEVAYGSLEVLPLAPGETAELTVQPLRRFDVGFGPGQGQKIRVYGGAVGLVIDARGRPIQLPTEGAARRSLVRQWLWDVGG